jgi:signal transduction histidine kinase
MPDRDTTLPDVPVRYRGVWVIASVFVVLTLAALVAIPVLVQRRVDEQRAAIENSEPARTLVISLQYHLVREMSTLSQYAVTGNPGYARTFNESRAAEQRVWNELAPLAADLGPAVHQRFVEGRTLAQTWHERIDRQDLLRRGRDAFEMLQAGSVRERFQEVIRTTARLDSAIIVRTRQSRERIQAAERVGLQLTFLSGALALLAAAVVGALMLRVRRLAAEAERRRREAADALALSARETKARQRLLRGITHDVKNPLGAARGYAELLVMGVKGPLNTDQEKLVQGVERSIDGALAIISDLLDLARADSGGISVHRISVDLAEVARQAADDHRPAAQAAGHEIVVQDGAGALISYTDPTRVRQVLDNLLSNAIKYTPPPGRILIGVDANADDAPFAKQTVAIRVSDTGPGIPAEQRDKIFDEFTRLDDGGAMKGHGLGLAIARRIARLLGGDLGLAEHDGRGSTFALWLPQREPRQDPN